MKSVRCPICEQRIVSEDSDELSANLRSHLAKQHDVDIQGNSGRFSSPTTSAEERRGMVKTTTPRTGLMGAEHRREEQAWAPEQGTPVPPRPSGIGDWVKKSLGTNEEAGGREEWSRGEGYPTMMQRSKSRLESETLECPMCGQTVTGRGEEDLSQSLEDHFRTEHRIVPRVVTH